MAFRIDKWGRIAREFQLLTKRGSKNLKIELPFPPFLDLYRALERTMEIFKKKMWRFVTIVALLALCTNKETVSKHILHPIT